MPQRTYLIFGDIEGKLDVLRVECTKCARKGRYRVARLIEKYGRRANMMKWKEQLNGDCPRRDAHKWIGGMAIVTCSTTPVSKYDWAKNEQRRAAIETIWLGSAIAFVPPAFVLAVGSAMIWAVRRYTMTSFTISIEPSRSPGKVTAMSSDGHSFTTTMPLLDGARYWQQLGAPSSAAIVTVWSSGPAGHWALRSTIGPAAKLAVSANRSGTPIFVPHKVQ